MSGLDAAIARIEAIETRIVSLDPAARTAAAQAPTETSSATGEASAARFAGVLEAASGAAGTASAAASAEVSGASSGTVAGAASAAGESGVGDPTTPAELIAALQTLFAAGSADAASRGGPSASARTIIEMAG
ncbi:hypothetical protein [Microbacterium foliorum]|uniref:hypothetical protein n=1 Tax=Microbacterium foliorum TaxID=104336 RepID=UPI001D9A969D|nr:hypothetical protein [Microbacterium foliorum]CAH0210430.1 hypothetical protein SRABI44_02155 [Microbacterium foliorum]CAH0249435.1 hypothetical protein SRABI03_03177 [Microbacterium foliorum]